MNVHNVLCTMCVQYRPIMNGLWTRSKSVWVDHGVFLSTLFLFQIMNSIEVIMYKLCAGYELHKLNYKLHMLIMGIMNRSWFDHTGRPTF